jgi:hypothetical protein
MTTALMVVINSFHEWMPLMAFVTNDSYSIISNKEISFTQTHTHTDTHTDTQTIQLFFLSDIFK